MSLGRFIVVEGLDGTGKTTFARELAVRLGAKLMSTPDPDIAYVRNALDERWHPVARRLVYAASALEVGRLAKRHVETGHDVVLDRYFASTIAYSVLDDERAPLACLAPLVVPADITFYLDADDEVRAARMASRGTSREEQRTLGQEVQAVRAAYVVALDAPWSGRVYELDGACPTPWLAVIDAARAQHPGAA